MLHFYITGYLIAWLLCWIWLEDQIVDTKSFWSVFSSCALICILSWVLVILFIITYFLDKLNQERT